METCVIGTDLQNYRPLSVYAVVHVQSSAQRRVGVEIQGFTQVHAWYLWHRDIHGEVSLEMIYFYLLVHN